MTVQTVTGARVRYKLTADALPATNNTLGDLIINTDGKKEEWTFSETGFVLRPISGGKPHVRSVAGTGEQNRNRFRKLDAAGARLSAEWPAGANITDLVFFASPVDGTTALTGDEHVLVAIDSVDTAAANAALLQTDSAIADVQWLPIPIGEMVSAPQNGALSNGSLGGGRVDMKTIGGVAIDLWIGAS